MRKITRPATALKEAMLRAGTWPPPGSIAAGASAPQQPEVTGTSQPVLKVPYGLQEVARDVKVIYRDNGRIAYLLAADGSLRCFSIKAGGEASIPAALLPTVRALFS